MSQQDLEQRVGNVEIVQARHGARLEHIESQVGRANVGIEKLLERDARRPQAMTWQTIVATCVGLGAVSAVGWWLVGSSPAVQDLEKRLTRLDDPEIGRITRVEKELGWLPRVTRADR